MAEETQQTCTKPLSLVAPTHLVKTIKSALEQADRLDRTTKISAATARDGIAGQYMSIPTTFTHTSHTADAEQDPQDLDDTHLLSRILAALNKTHLEDRICLAYTDPRDEIKLVKIEKNPLLKALSEGLANLPSSLLSSLGITVRQLISAVPESYSIYPPLLLLPHNAFTSPPWQTLFCAHPASDPVLQVLWKHITSATHTTHIAVNSPIPLLSSPSPSTATQQNILRSPLTLTPVYGPFGPPPTPRTLSQPTSQDFQSALWVSAVQNGIHQTWAPLYTMFSRGNMREKTRLLTLPSVMACVRDVDDDAEERTSVALDAYAGIGYFAYSYARAGLRSVLCFELNAWSVEGLVRGAALNGWTTRVFREGDVAQERFAAEVRCAVREVEFVVFHMSNERAEEVLATCLADVVSVRHVNLGLLPGARGAWRMAARVLCGERGGWVHVHENVGVGGIEERRGGVERAFRGFVEEVDGERGDAGGRRVHVEHVERVKMYAPGVVHCVFDVCVDGRGKRT